MEPNKETYSFLQFNTVFIPFYCNPLVCFNLQTQNYTLSSGNAEGHFRNSNNINRILECQRNNSNYIAQNFILPTENEPQIPITLMAQSQEQNCLNNQKPYLKDFYIVQNKQENKNSQDNLNKQRKTDIKNLQAHLMQLGKTNWTTQQQQKLKQLVNLFGKRWKFISQHFPNRTGKQIRERYLNYLRPNLSLKRWTPEEDNHIIQLVNKYGRSWRRVEKKLKNRSQNQIKNRYYGHLQKSQKLAVTDKTILVQPQHKKQHIKTEASLVIYEQSVEPIQA